MPKGTYVSNSEVVYDAIPNLATVTFDANGLYYNNDESLTTNTLGYKPNVAEAPIELVTGEYLTPAPFNPDSSSDSSSSSSSSSSIHYTFLGWSEDKDATEATYVDEQDILANLTLTKNESLTLYAVWHYNTVLSFNGNTSDGGEPIADITIPAGTTITLPQNTYTRTGSVFTNWNTVVEPTEQDPGEDYEDEADFTATDSSADITLYAQWAYYTTITFNGNGETSGTMSPQDIVAGDPTNLVPNAYTKTNHTFIGWNTVQNPTPENPGTTYQDQAEFIASTTQHEDITLYAQWASTTISFNGNTSESGTMNPIAIAGGTSTTLPQNTYTKSHCTFTSWNTTADGTGTRYPGEASYTASMEGIYSFTLYAQWQCESMINFNGNGADSGYMPGIMATGGQQTTLPQNTFTKEDYIFASWNTAPDGTGTSYPDQGTYTAPVSESKTITLYAQWTDCAPNNICYNDNGANSSTTMDPQSASSNTETTLWASNYKYDTNNDGHNDYGFAGWSEDKDAAAKLVDNDSTNNPVVYGPNQTITTGDLSTAGMKLYAVWIAPEENTTFQDFTCPSNETMPIGTVIALKDNRDNEVYTVAKLADGNCWMTENLRLDNNVTINATNTNNPISTFTALNPSSNSWCIDSTASCYNQSMLNTNNIANTVSPMTRTDANIYSYSNYYNWYSATAGNGTYSKSSRTESGDLCPADWMLPIGDQTSANGSFSHLDTSMGGTGSGQRTTEASNRWRSFPNNFVYSGNCYGSPGYYRGYSGIYWSSTAYSTNSAYNLNFGSGDVYPGTNYNKKVYGFSVRCVAR